MLFYLNQFELHIPESILKRGFNLFQSAAVLSIEGPSTFTVNGTELQLKIKNNQLQSYSCNCHNTTYCQHLAAVLFHLQDSKLNLPTVNDSLKKNSPIVSSFQLDKELQKIIFKSELINYPSKKNKGQSKKHFNYFEAFVNLHVCRFKTLNNKTPLHQNQIDALYKSFNQSSQFIKFQKNKEVIFNWLLSELVFFILLNDYRFLGDETNLIRKLEEVKNELNQFYLKGLDSAQKQSWFKACLISLQSNKFVKSGLFYFLVPKYISQSKSLLNIEKLENCLKQRQFKKPYDEALNKMEIVKYHLYFKLHQLPQQINFNDNSIIEPEYLLALCDFLFNQNKIKKAFQILNDAVMHFLSKQVASFRTISFYAIEKSRTYAMEEYELKYLRLSLIHNLQINDGELVRYKKITPKAQSKQAFKSLIEEIKLGNSVFKFDKLCKLYLFTDNHHDLIELIVQEKNKFKLLHQSLLKLAANIPVKLLQVYSKQLGTALRDANTFSQQKQLLSLLFEFQSLLTETQSNELIDFVFNETGYESQIGKFISHELETLSA